MSKRKTILLCVTGLTPQIVTETLFVLMTERKVQIDEIRVMTTLDGRNQILKALLDPVHGKFFAFCRDFGFDPGQIKFDETTIWLLRSADSMLRDIRTEDDNLRAGNQICELVRSLTTDPETVIYASVAGGRKTMGIYLTAAMQLFGRSQDHLSHVLVSEEFETHPEFYYIPPVPQQLAITDRMGALVRHISTGDAQIFLANIPFIRLRGLLRGWEPEASAYDELVHRAQDNLNIAESAYEIRIRLGTGRHKQTVRIANRTVKLTEREFFFYVLFAEAQRLKMGPIGLHQFTEGLVDVVLERIFRARGIDFDPAESLPPKFDFIRTLRTDIRSWAQSETYQKSLKDSVGQALSRLHRKFEAEDLPTSCWIKSSGERGALQYELNLPPERIVYC